ncbi:MAG: CPBP family intramembrane metalloprotease [Cetobacterium sp.]|nr:CPBP family intramembrane metalloprotease [Cetobacterium sp.]
MINKIKKEIKIGLLTTLIYISIMGLGMFLMNKVFHYSYNDANMARIIIFVEIILTILVILVTKKYYGFDKIGFKKLKFNQLKWFIPSIIIISIMTFIYGITLINNIETLDKSKIILLIIIFISTFLVGFSEEVMFRGILLHSFTNKGKIYSGLIVSSILFALLHSVNMFGGVTFGGMVTQVCTSFLLGIYFAPLAIKLESLIPLIIFHWLWDCILVSSSVLEINLNIIPLFQIIFNILLGIILWKLIKLDKFKN